ncbi:farnesol dehydrogenase [Plutella xylostella]|uniref:farnesol dehydrogenase n=1 Tax=Plutella xylostella TaxID=51655 RepID=UPI002032E555|nr:farnesol dehydrogenase [Plutella xylostella]
MERWAGKTAVVTGASSGIGAATALALADRGLRVVGLARRLESMQKLQSRVTGSGSITARRCDVSKPEDLKSSFEWIEETFGGVDVMVNNAGVFIHGNITDIGSHPLSEDELVSVLDVNVKGLMLCTRRAVDSMRRRGVDGHVININSIAGHYVPTSQFFNVYSSTKHAVTAFTQSLCTELAEYRSGIRVTSISPGLTRTELLLDDKVPGVKEAVEQLPALAAEDVADAVVYVLSTPVNVNITELTIQPVGEKKL